jgi:hypothetical protein
MGEVGFIGSARLGRLRGLGRETPNVNPISFRGTIIPVEFHLELELTAANWLITAGTVSA